MERHSGALERLPFHFDLLRLVTALAMLPTCD